MAITSFIKRILGIYKPRIILQARDPHDITPEEVQELAALFYANFEYKVDIATNPEQVGKGITLNEVLYIWLIPAGFFLAKKAAEEVAKIVIQWTRNRLRKKGTTRRPTTIFIYGPNGKVIKSVVVKDATQEVEDHTEANRKSKWKHKPPPLEDRFTGF